ncbi:MAG: WbqC family protein [Verrucomicrobiae bacterium]|nr:WbqC family protein [Verrucomicrobiae bacterium]
MNESGSPTTSFESSRETVSLPSPRVAVMQPYFLPYLGYFQLMAAVDRFVILDDVNFIKRGWINRNRILLDGTPHWMTIPLVGASQNRCIHEIEIVPDSPWREKLGAQVSRAYREAPHGEDACELLKILTEIEEPRLSVFLRASLELLRGFLGIQTSMAIASEVHPREELRGQDRIIDICRRESAGAYLNPPGGEMLYDAPLFHEAGLELAFLRPRPAEYQQGKIGSEFVPDLSILDAIAWIGRDGCHERLSQYRVDIRK